MMLLSVNGNMNNNACVHGDGGVCFNGKETDGAEVDDVFCSKCPYYTPYVNITIEK